MAVDGFIIHFDTADVRELVRVLIVTNNRHNQLTKRVHEIGNIYAEGIGKIAQKVKDIKGYLKDYTSSLIDDAL